MKATVAVNQFWDMVKQIAIPCQTCENVSKTPWYNISHGHYTLKLNTSLLDVNLSVSLNFNKLNLS